MGGHPYKIVQKAFIINYADYCIAKNLDYDESVVSAFRKRFKREMTLNQVKSQMSRILKAVFSAPKISPLAFKKEGTGSISQDGIANVPAKFLSMMNQQRKQMRLKKVEAREDTKDSTDDLKDQDVEEDDEDSGDGEDEDVGEGSSVLTDPEAVGFTETAEHEDVGSSDNPMRIEETPETTGFQGTAADGNDFIADSTTAVGDMPTRDTVRADAATETSVKDTATTAAVVLETTRPTQSPISPGDARPESSEKVLGKRKASEAPIKDVSLSKRPDLGRPEDNLDQRSGVETTGGINPLSDKKPDPRHAANEARVALQLACAVYRAVRDSGKDVPHDILGSIMQTVRQIPDFNEDLVLAMALRDADSQTKLLEESEDMVASLVGELEYNTKTVFPKTLSHEDVHQEWRAFQQQVMYTAGHNYDTPTPCLGAAGYLTRSVEAIADGRVSVDDLNDDIRALRDCLVSPHAHQTLLSALICRWVFNSPEAMSKDHHPVPVMKILQTAECSGGGLQQVQHIDKLVTQRMFVDPDHQPIIARRERLFCQDFTKAAQALCKPHPIQPPPIEKLASAAIILKHKLMLSPDNYCIHYCLPETLFDPLWMQAVDAKNFAIADADALGKEITICMFPALMSQKPEAFGKDAKIEDALAMNKRFFPTSNEKRSLDPSFCLCKATVLVLL